MKPRSKDSTRSRSKVIATESRCLSKINETTVINDEFDYAIVGAGVLGLACARQLAIRRKRVVVFERDPKAMSASVRNFGMLWPIGQPKGNPRRLALRSLEIWREVLEESGAWHERSGSLHLAYHPDEEQVLKEFAEEANSDGFPCHWIKPEDVKKRSRHVKAQGLLGALYSENEICVDPREVISVLPVWLAKRYGVRFEFGTAVSSYDQPVLRAGGREWRSQNLVVCSGADVRTLYPSELDALGLALANSR